MGKLDAHSAIYCIKIFEGIAFILDTSYSRLKWSIKKIQDF